MDKPNSIGNVPHLDAFIETMRSQLGAIDPGLPILYLVDQVPEPALFWLASQFDVLGTKGWNLCTTDAQRRTLIKEAIALHRRKGTPFAIKDALRRVGFPVVIIDEGVQHNAAAQSWPYDATLFYSGPYEFLNDQWHWAEFGVTIVIDEYSPSITTSLGELLLDLIKHYQAARSHLKQFQVMTKPRENPRVSGILDLVVYDGGSPILTWQGTNLVVNGGLEALTHALSGVAGNDVNTIGIGEGTAATAATDTSLTNTFSKTLAAILYPGTGQVTYKWEITTAEANGMTISEAGLSTSSGALFNRILIPAVTKTGTMSISGEFTITIT